MRLSDFTYELPSELIAQHPAENRQDSRLMVVCRDRGSIDHGYFRDLPQYLDSDDLLVLNNTRVFPARLIGVKGQTGARIEALLLREVSKNVWEALVRPARRLPPGTRIDFGSGRLIAEVHAGSGPEKRELEFLCERDLMEILLEIGRIPLPPYIERNGDEWEEEDRIRYQTVYSRTVGSVAAPTAGLHFTPDLLARMDHCELTLHVGYGTFKPVTSEKVEEHVMEAEYFTLKEDSAERIQRQLEKRGRVIAVGTTTTRALEHLGRQESEIQSRSGWTNLFIYPGFQFRVVRGLITNFHLPGSTLLLLVSAFAGTELIREAYQRAVEMRYRFYSYGDAMLIL